VSRRQRHAGYGRVGLFEFDPTDPDAIRDVPDNPLTRRCPKPPGCGAPIGQRCTRPARGGRKDLAGYHDARKKPAETITEGDPHGPHA
jgi:hypothetical protein